MSATYDTLVAKLHRAHHLRSINGLLGWDEQVNLPPDSADLRGEQMAIMAELEHQAASDPAIGDALTTLEQQRETLSADQQVVVREARKDFDRVALLPADFVTEKARHSSAAYHAWTRCKPANDFASYAPFIAKHLDLAKREAALQGWADRPYDYMIDQHDPGFTAGTIGTLFSELKAGLVPLVQRITASPRQREVKPLRGFPVEAQAVFLREVTEKLGFNYRRGRIDVAPHPFCEGSGADVRLTTRYAPDEPLDSLFSSIHEAGHGMYEQGLPLADHATPLGQHAGMAMHESQSRMWENQVGRSRAVWHHFEPRYRELFGTALEGVSSDDLHLAVNAVQPTFIRVDSDEVHYNLHIILRFEIEQRLFSGELAVADLPDAWNALSEELMGSRPPDDQRGVLQDVHWSGGAFGYFPSYCLGNMIAAQLWAQAQRDLPELKTDFARGEFGRLLTWLRTNVHAHGRRYSALALVERVTGSPLSPRPLLAYLEERYATLYRV
ncbi:carboxypeptidase M32 [Synoicihabitans lomoniglobus]|uniref:Metal-dependent carboxypeptidase n=1 Tax=Synoicihabitans lomoniglobus TaxID=2909285 RepID=A0AAF0CQW1_9BACT|nr:carboxypeptidase M32 [Opitutaceae bacterium LMO-M01]WED66397.1 carboxypeptidase M32 [Opitutaceae bacterium LMO-M01]